MSVEVVIVVSGVAWTLEVAVPCHGFIQSNTPIMIAPSIYFIIVISFVFIVFCMPEKGDFCPSFLTAQYYKKAGNYEMTFFSKLLKRW